MTSAIPPPCSQPAAPRARRDSGTPLQPLDVARARDPRAGGTRRGPRRARARRRHGARVDYADLYFQLVREESWSLEDGIVKDGAHSIEQGVGVRALAGEKTGFAYSDEIVLPALTRSRAGRARDRAQRRDGVAAGVACVDGGRSLYLPIDPIDALERSRQGAAARAHRSRGAARSIRASSRSWRACRPRTKSCS